MNSTQIHLALTHVPVILSLIGLIILVVGLLKKNSILTKTALYIFLAAGVFVVPVGRRRSLSGNARASTVADAARAIPDRHRRAGSLAGTDVAGDG